MAQESESPDLDTTASASAGNAETSVPASSVQEKTPSGAVDTELSAAQGTENFIETYHAISEWIRFADAKAAVILTVGGALAGFLIPTVQKVIESTPDEAHLIPVWKTVCLVLFGLYIFFLLTSGVFAFQCINPLRKKGRHPSLKFCQHFHPAAISAAYTDDEVERFVSDCDQIGSTALQREVQAAILLDSHISSVKYNRVRYSLIQFAMSVFFGFSYFILTQV